MKREILNQIVKHFTDLYADEINADEVTDDVIHEWWGYTRDQYGYDTEGGGNEVYPEVERAIWKTIRKI